MLEGLHQLTGRHVDESQFLARHEVLWIGGQMCLQLGYSLRELGWHRRRRLVWRLALGALRRRYLSSRLRVGLGVASGYTHVPWGSVFSWGYTRPSPSVSVVVPRAASYVDDVLLPYLFHTPGGVLVLVVA